MVTADVVVPLELPVVLAHVPIFVSHHAMLEPAVVQHRQVEPATIPAHQLRRVFFDRIEEGLDDPALGLVILVHERMDTQPIGIAKHGADDQHALQVQRHEVGLAFLPAFRQPGSVNVGVAGIGRRAAQGAQTHDIRDRFNIEDQNRPAHGIQAAAYRAGRYLAGSTGLPWRRTSKCSLMRSASLLPISAIFCPLRTLWSSFTSSSWLCA